MPQGDYVIEDYEVADPCGWAKTVTTTSYTYTLVATQAKLYLTSAAAQADIDKLTGQGLPAARFGVGRKPGV